MCGSSERKNLVCTMGLQVDAGGRVGLHTVVYLSKILNPQTAPGGSPLVLGYMADKWLRK